MIKILATKIFSLSSDIDWEIIACEDDPRGFCEVYGKTIGALYPLTPKIYFKDLSVFWDHLSVEIVDLCDLVVSPCPDGIEIQVIKPNRTRTELVQLENFSLVNFLKNESQERRSIAL